jgi:nucleotide sugar dehydrogenase
VRIGVLGVGKLGLCFALNLERAGFEIVGVDIVPEYIQALSDRQFSSPEPGVDELLAQATSIEFSIDTASVIQDDIDLIFIMVATPSKADGTYDHQQVDRVVKNLEKFGKVKKNVQLAIGCTTMPGYCDDLQQRLAPLNYAVSYNPEFIAQGTVIHDQQYPDQVLIGEANEEAGDLLQSVYQKMCLNEPTYCRMDRLSAEICKLATNCFLTTKISFANSIGDLARKVGADEEKILSAIGSDSRIGSKYLNYGFGYGGPCLSRDNRALGIYADSREFDLKLSKATDAVNQQHLEFQFEGWKTRYPEGSEVVFDHVSYKKGSVSIEESQQLALAVRLAQAGRQVIIKDRKEVIEQVKALYPGLFTFEQRLVN